MCRTLLAGYCSRRTRNQNDLQRTNHNLDEVLLVGVGAHRTDSEVIRSRCRAGCDRKVGQPLQPNDKTVDHPQKAKRMRQKWLLIWATNCSNLQILSGKRARSRWLRPWQTSSRNAMPTSLNGCRKVPVVNRAGQAARGVKIRAALPNERLTRQPCSMRHAKGFLNGLQSPPHARNHKNLSQEAAMLHSSLDNVPPHSLDSWSNNLRWISALLRNSVARM